MAKAAILVLAGTDTHADGGRVYNALETAREFKEAGDEVELIFDGAATQWIPEIEDPDHKYHESYRTVQEDAGFCEFCAGAFGVEDPLADSDAVALESHDGHPSIRSLVADGYEVITF